MSNLATQIEHQQTIIERLRAALVNYLSFSVPVGAWVEEEAREVLASTESFP